MAHTQAGLPVVAHYRAACAPVALYVHSFGHTTHRQSLSLSAVAIL